MSAMERMRVLEERDSSLSLCMPEILTIEQAAGLAAELKQLNLTSKTCLVIDVSLVKAVTTPVIQLMVATEKALTSHGGTMTIAGAKEPFITALRDLGLECMLGSKGK